MVDFRGGGRCPGVETPVCTRQNPPSRIGIDLTHGGGFRLVQTGVSTPGTTLRPLIRSLALALLIAAAGCHDTSGAGSASPPETPRRIYTLHCLGCHGARGEGAMGSNIQGLNRSIDQMVAIIANGQGKMPDYRGHLSDQQMRAVAAYVKTFKFSK